MSVKVWGPRARRLAPVGLLVLACAGVGVVIAMHRATSLPKAAPSALLADLRAASPDASYGTIAERADLGLPAVAPSAAPTPASTSSAAGPDAFGDGFGDGTHTMRAWYDGPTRQRVAVVDATSESDLIRNGSDLWVWSSRGNVARHTRLSGAAGPQSLPAVLASLPGRVASPAQDPGGFPGWLPKTPQSAASALLSSLGAGTAVSLGPPVKVAGRRAYQLIVAPRLLTSSLISAIRIAVDGQRHVALRVQVFAKAYAKPAYEVGYTEISFERPDRTVFAFNPPPGAVVTAQPAQTPPPSEVIGSGWSAVLVAHLPKPLGTPAMPAIDGVFGPGHLLETRLVTALLLDDGQVIVGAVEPTALITAASREPRQPRRRANPDAAPTLTPRQT